jgi:hypothetical protein
LRPPHSKEQNKKQSEAALKFHLEHPEVADALRSLHKGKSIRYPNIIGKFTKLDGYLPCKCCKRMFWSVGLKVTCSPECARINSSYRKIVHNYNNNGVVVKLESRWEVVIANWLDKNNIQWIRPNHLNWIDSKSKKRKYFPDFYLPKFDLYLDPKNSYQISIGKEKLAYITSRYNLVFGEINHITTYVTNLLDPRVGLEPTRSFRILPEPKSGDLPISRPGNDITNLFSVNE